MKNYIARALSIIMSIIICISFTFGGNAMAIAETISGNASSDASSNAVPMATDNNNDVYTFKDKDAGVKVLVAKKDSWDNGYVANISIENTGSESLSNWHIGLKVKGDIDSVWNSEYEIKDGKLTLSYPTWKRKISAGETYTIGMKVNGTFGDFEDFSYYEDAKDVSDLYKIEYKVRNTWAHHAIIDAFITNTGDTTLRDWSLAMDYDADIVDIWNADVVSNEGGSYRLKCKDYNADIKPDESVTFGFQAQYEGDEVILPINSKLIAVADSKLVPTKTDKADWYKVMTNADSEEALRMRDNVKDRVKVAIIDSGVDYMGEGDEINRVDFIGDTDEENPLYDDRSGHGTGVAGMLVGVGSIEDDEEEEETTEAEAADVDFSYLTDADYIEPVDVEDEEDDADYDLIDEDDYNEEDFDDDDYDDEDYDLEDSDEESYEEDEDDAETSDNDVIDGIDDSDDSDDEEDIDDDHNLFEYNDLYGDIEGLNPNIELISLRVLDEDNEAPVSRVIEAIEWAIDNDINILNLSWGVDTDNAELHNVIKRAYNKGMLIIAAAGNDGSITYPAKYDEVIAVGSVDSMAKIAMSSASGDGIELVAPAENVIAYTSFGILTFVSGTSYAAPQITALASILWQQDITVSNKCIRELLRQSASPLGDSMCYGYGIADYEKAAGIYEEFVKGYEDSVEEEAVAERSVISADADSVETGEVNVVDEEYVSGLWGPHDEIAEEGIEELKNAKVKGNYIEALKNGLMWPDKEKSGLKGMTDNPAFHGGIRVGGNKKKVNGYIIGVDGYVELMQMAKNMAKNGNIAKMAYKSDIKLTLVKKTRTALNKYHNKNQKSNVSGKTTVTKNAEKNETAYFIMGMALHSLGDLYSHQAYGFFNKSKYYYDDSGVKDVPDYYSHIIHGCKKAEINDSMLNELNIEKKYFDSIKGQFFDNHADCPEVTPKRYSYTKDLYTKIIRKKVNLECGKSKRACASDYYIVSKEGLCNSDNLLERIKCMEDHFAIKDFADYVSADADENVNNIDMKSLYEKYKKWAKVDIEIDKSQEVSSVNIYKVSSDANGAKEYRKVADSLGESSMLCSENASGNGTYTFICDTDTVYVLRVEAGSGSAKRCTTKLFRIMKSEASMCPFEDDTLTIHNVNENKGGFEYSFCDFNEAYCKYVDIHNVNRLNCDKQFFLQHRIINIDNASFNSTALAGDVVDSDDSDKPLNGVEVELIGQSGNKYEAVTDSNGNYLFDDSCHLCPDVYQFVASKEGYLDIKGSVIVRSDSSNWMPRLFMQRYSDLKCKEITGYITDDKNGNKVAGLYVELCKGVYPNRNDADFTTVSNKDGEFVFSDIDIGMYTIRIIDKRNVDFSDRYLDYQTLIVAKPGQENKVDCIVSKSLNNGEIRVVLTWGDNPKDLDGHLYLDEDGTHCFYGNRIVNNGYVEASLDRDDTRGNGCETMTVKLKTTRSIKYTVHNYSENNRNELSLSNATVNVYFPDGSNRLFPVPNDGNGYYWDVFKYDGSSMGVTPINTIR